MKEYWTLEILTEVRVRPTLKGKNGKHSGRFYYRSAAVFDRNGKEIQRVDVDELKKKKKPANKYPAVPISQFSGDARIITGLVNNVCERENLELVAIKVLPWRIKNFFFFKRLYFLESK